MGCQGTRTRSLIHHRPQIVTQLLVAGVDSVVMELGQCLRVETCTPEADEEEFARLDGVGRDDLQSCLRVKHGGILGKYRESVGGVVDRRGAGF